MLLQYPYNLTEYLMLGALPMVYGLQLVVEMLANKLPDIASKK